MSDYINRKSVYDALCKICDARGVCEHTGKEGCHKVFAQIPAADVRENVRGEWVVLDDKLPDGKWVCCSNCRQAEHLEYNREKLTWKFCPECGADKRKENK